MKQEHATTISSNTNSSSGIEILLLKLQSEDGAERKHARQMLEKIGKSAVPAIMQLLSHRREHVRWEACKTLESIRDRKAEYALVHALLDDDMDVRWVAADAIITLEEHAFNLKQSAIESEHHAIIPLLEIIGEHFDSVFIREAAHHILHTLKRKNILDKNVEEVLIALEDLGSPWKVAFAASIALDYLRSKEKNKEELKH